MRITNIISYKRNINILLILLNLQVHNLLIRQKKLCLDILWFRIVYNKTFVQLVSSPEVIRIILNE